MTCDLCGAVMFPTRDCSNAECVQSARMLTDQDIAWGVFYPDGRHTQRSAGGTLSGTMKPHVVDAEWARQMFEFMAGNRRDRG